MSNFIRYSKRTDGNCPICQEQSTKCGQDKRNLDLFYCMNRDDEVEGYKNLGRTNGGGIWNKYLALSDNGATFQKKQRRPVVIENKSIDTALAGDRDKAIRKIANSLGLRKQHEKLLLSRGLTLAQIQKFVYFSVDLGLNRVPDSVPNGFPSVQRAKKSGIDFEVGDKVLYSPTRGIACVAFDYRGLAIGFQIRDEDPTSEQKYKWLPRLHLRNGEMPITLIKSQENEILKSNTAFVCEGIGIKTQLASNLLNGNVIGAAGGNFSGSPKQFTKIQETLDLTNVIILPDGGDLINPQVRKRWSRQERFFRKLGLKVSFLWWGQEDKTDKLDIDEITPERLATAELLTPFEFFKLPTYKSLSKKEWRKSKTYRPHTIINLPFFDYPVPDENTILGIKSPLGTGKTEWLLKLINELIDERFIYPQYRNALNLGFVGKVADRFGEGYSDEFFKYLHDYKSIEKIRNKETGDLPNLALCIDSFLKLDDDDFDGVNLICDEIISMIKHACFSSTLRKNRIAVLDKFKTACQRAKRIILLDGHLTDWACNYIHQLAPNKQLIKVENTIKKEPHNVIFLQGELDDDDDDIKQNAFTSFQRLMTEKKHRFVVVSDSKRHNKTLTKIFESTFPNARILRVDSETKSEEKLLTVYQNGGEIPANEIDMFCYDPDTYIRRNNIDILLMTPTCESGIDISIENWFEAEYGFFFGTLDVDSTLQIIKRVRPNIPRYIWCREWSSNNELIGLKSPFASTIEEAIKMDIATEIFDAQSFGNSFVKSLMQTFEFSMNETFKVCSFIKAFRNYEHANFRACVKEALINNNYTVNDFVPDFDKDVQDFFKDAKKAVNNQECKEILEADYIPTDYEISESKDLPWLRSSLTRTPSKADQVGKINQHIRKQFPTIEDSEFWNLDLILELRINNPTITKRLELLYRFFNPEISENMHKEQISLVAKKDKIHLTDINMDAKFLKALHSINFMRLISDVKVYNNETPEVLEMFDTLKKSKKLQNDLRVNVGKTPRKNACSIVQKIASHLAIKQKAKGQSRKVSQDKKTINKDAQARNYALELPFSNALYSKLYECIGIRLDKYHPINFDLDLENASFFYNEGNDRSENIVTHGLEGATVGYDNIQYNQENTVAQNTEEDMPEDFEFSEDNIEDVKNSLSVTYDKFTLAFLRECYSPELLKTAYLRLPDNEKRIIRDLTIQLNQEKINT